MFSRETEEEDLNKAINVIWGLVTVCGLIREPSKVKENSIPPKGDFELNWDKIVFRIFTRKEAVIWKTNYSSVCFSLGTTYEKNMNEIDFLTCATNWSIFVAWRVPECRGSRICLLFERIINNWTLPVIYFGSWISSLLILTGLIYRIVGTYIHPLGPKSHWHFCHKSSWNSRTRGSSTAHHYMSESRLSWLRSATRNIRHSETRCSQLWPSNGNNLVAESLVKLFCVNWSDSLCSFEKEVGIQLRSRSLWARAACTQAVPSTQILQKDN